MATTEMNGHFSKPSHHALLIGIDAYQQKPLQGAVRDVQRIQAYLQEVLPSISVITLTASNCLKAESNIPVEDPQRWLTHHNIRSAFRRITDLAREGDFVYIYFSGHGTRETLNAKSYNEFSGDLAFVILTSVVEDPETYLFGRSFAYLMNGMVLKGLVVTAILDCCYAGSVYRCEGSSDPGIRCLPFDKGIASRVSIEGAQPSDIPSNFEHRDASMLPNWLINLA